MNTKEPEIRQSSTPSLLKRWFLSLFIIYSSLNAITEKNTHPLLMEELINLIENDPIFISSPADQQASYSIGIGTSLISALQVPNAVNTIHPENLSFSTPIQLSIASVYKYFEGTLNSTITPIRLFKLKDQPQPAYVYQFQFLGSSGLLLPIFQARVDLIIHLGINSRLTYYVNGLTYSRFSTISPYLGFSIAITSQSYLELFADYSLFYRHFLFKTSQYTEKPNLVSFQLANYECRWKTYYSETILTQFNVIYSYRTIKWNGWRQFSSFDTLGDISVIYSIGRLF